MENFYGLHSNSLNCLPIASCVFYSFLSSSHLKQRKRWMRAKWGQHNWWNTFSEVKCHSESKVTWSDDYWWPLHSWISCLWALTALRRLMMPFEFAETEMYDSNNQGSHLKILALLCVTQHNVKGTLHTKCVAFKRKCDKNPHGHNNLIIRLHTDQPNSAFTRSDALKCCDFKKFFDLSSMQQVDKELWSLNK